LLERVDAVVVVGGPNSNNTRELVARCDERGKPVVHVQDAADLNPAWFRDFATVGLTAGTSTLPETIDQVHRGLVWIGSSLGVSEQKQQTCYRATGFHE
jgi:4-hydroxy-3-methylbut-2-en-1-yl diphosphate reductase